METRKKKNYLTHYDSKSAVLWNLCIWCNICLCYRIALSEIAAGHFLLVKEIEWTKYVNSIYQIPSAIYGFLKVKLILYEKLRFLMFFFIVFSISYICNIGKTFLNLIDSKKNKIYKKIRYPWTFVLFMFCRIQRSNGRD